MHRVPRISRLLCAFRLLLFVFSEGCCREGNFDVTPRRAIDKIILSSLIWVVPKTAKRKEVSPEARSLAAVVALSLAVVALPRHAIS